MNKKKIIRVFPRRTNATPDDDNVRIDVAPTLFDEADEIHISVVFTWDIPKAEFLERQWKYVAPVKLGGPAFNNPGGDFIPGMYMKKGYIITSRGCTNRCWFCSVPKREGGILRELPITEGWIVTDDNLLACTSEHINKVFKMLKRQPKKAQFTGGLEARLLTNSIAIQLFELKPDSLYFAYDTLDDYEHLIQASKYLLEAGFTKRSHILKCYVLIGYQKDTFYSAEKRLIDTIKAGYFPMAMLYRDIEGKYSKEWKQFQRLWANKYIVGAKMKKYGCI